VGLTIATIATWGLFEVFLPTLLTMVSVVAGPGPWRAARTCRRVGREGRKGIARAARRVRALSRAATPTRSDRRVRVDPASGRERIRVDFDDGDRNEDWQDWAGHDDAARARSRR
jgi:hypothetical protein